MIGEKWRGYYLTAYGIAVKHGYTGTEEEWLESLVGPEGKRLELNVIDGNLMYRHEGDKEYKTLLSVEEFRGEEIDLLISEINSAKADSIASATDAYASKNQTKNYAENASKSETNAQTAALAAEKSAQSAENNAQNTKQYASEAKDYASSASLSKDNAQIAAQSAGNSATSASESEKNAQKYSDEAKKARDDVSEIAGFDASNYVKKTDYATIGGEHGLIKLPSNASRGLSVHGTTGEVRVYGGEEGAISGKSSRHVPICADKLDFAVKLGITTNSYSLTDAEKKAVANWLGISRIGVTSYIGTGTNPYHTYPNQIAENDYVSISLPSWVTYGILFDASDIYGLSAAWSFNVNNSGEWYTIDEWTIQSLGCSLDVRFRADTSGDGYILEWYIRTDSLDVGDKIDSRDCMNVAGKKYIFVYFCEEDKNESN